MAVKKSTIGRKKPKKVLKKKVVKKKAIKKNTVRRKSVRKVIPKDNYNKRVIEELKQEMLLLKQTFEERATNKLEDNVQNLNEQIVKMVSVNINLQSKMTELLIKVTDLIRENREIISLLEEASEIEPSIKQKGKLDYEGVFLEVKKISLSTSKISEENKELLEYMKKMYTKQLLNKTLNGNISLPQSIKNEEKKIVNI